MLLSRVPVLRILLPLMAGILLHELWPCVWMPLTLMAVSVIAYAWMSLWAKSPGQKLRLRPYYIAPLAMVALSLGWLAAAIHCPPQLKDTERHDRLLTGRVAGLEYTDFSMRMTIDVLDKDLPDCRVLVTTRGCDYTARAGDIVTWPAALEEVHNSGNPDEMDYASLMLHGKGIRYEQHLAVADVKRSDYSPTLRTRLAEIRRGLANKIYNTELSPGAQHLIVAMLLGDSHPIDKVTRAEFSTAGIAHVLALSGLHVGIIAMLIYLLLFPLDYLGYRRLRLAITLAAIILFAMFTGLSPSVVRATVMTGLVLASLIFHRRSVSLNALAMAALVILVCSPSDLFNAGFQLSFITVGALLLFARVPERLQSGNHWVDGLTATVIASIVAMLATIALNAHYFHTVSLMSVLANVLVLAVLPLFMVLAALLLLVTAAGMQWAPLEYCVESIYRYIHGVARGVSATPMSHVDGVYVSTTGVILYFAILGLVILWLNRRHIRWLMAAGVLLLVAIGHSAWLDWHTPKRGLVVFNAFTSTPVFYYDNGKGYVWVPDNEDVDLTEFERTYAGFLARRGIGDVRLVPNDSTLRVQDALIAPPYALLTGRRLLAAGSGSKRGIRTAVDDIIVTKRYHKTIAKLQEQYDFGRVIISGAQQDDATAALMQECDSLGIPVHCLATQGAVVVE
ncbi:MAG: ComEC/Rec2 family competence protein [Muribaculaceae bacterium]|nr:ComEC/Rec2 family competence protein [Muribaculaceae bacterium]